MANLDWPAERDRTPENERRSYPHGFDVSRSRAFESVLGELAKMDAMHVQLDTGAEHQKRNPNKPYADARFDDPGVVARYELDGTQYAVAMDRWDNPRDNARAIALTLDAKRALTRYGVETVESEFRRHELPPPGETDEDANGSEDVTGNGGVDAPHEVLGVAPDAPEAVVKGAARSLKADRHPDANGTQAEFKRVVNAEKVMLGEK